MTAYLVVSIKVHDPSWVEAYSTSVPALVHKHGGDYVAVSEAIRRVEGTGPDPDGIVLFTFPTMDAVDAFLSDPEYAPLKAARLAGSSSEMFAFVPRG